MAKVPYSPGGQIAPSNQALPGLSGAGADEAAFGVGVAREGQRLGAQLEKSGDEIWARAVALQTLANESAAKDADAEFVVRMSEVHANYQSLQGKAALDARPQYIEDLRKIREDVGVHLNSAARKSYDSSTRQMFARAVFNSAGHAATEMRRYANGASEARITANQRDTLTFPNDDLAFERGIEQNANEIRNTQAPIKGWSPEQVDEAIRTSTSGMYAARISGMVKTEPFKAAELLEKNRDKLIPVELERVENKVLNATRTVGARQIESEVNKDLYDGQTAPGKPSRGLDERVQEGVRKAKEFAPNDELLPEYVAQRIRAGYSGKKRDEADTNNFHRLNIASAINGDYGKIPTTPDDLKAISPQIAASWDALPATMRGGMLRAMANNAKGDYPETEANYREYRKLLGQAGSPEDAERLKFFDTNLVELQMPRKWRNTLLKEQERLTKQSEADPRVNRAMKLLTDAGIAPTVAKTDADTVSTFRGGMQILIQDYQEEFKKQPDPQKIKEFGAQLVQEQSDPSKISVFGLFNRTTPLYQQKPPTDVVEEVKKDPRWKKLGIEPTDEMIQRHYVRDLYNKRFKKSTGEAVPVKEGARVPQSE